MRIWAAGKDGVFLVAHEDGRVMTNKCGDEDPEEVAMEIAIKSSHKGDIIIISTENQEISVEGREVKYVPKEENNAWGLLNES